MVTCARSNRRAARPKAALIRWNEDLRLGLDILMRDIKFDHTSAAAVFAQAFDDHLTKCGMPQVRWNKLYIQYREKNKPANHRNWAVCLVNSQENTARRQDVTSKIRNAAQELNIVGRNIVNGSIQSAVPRLPSAPSRNGTPPGSTMNDSDPVRGPPGASTARTPSSVTRKRSASPLADFDDEDYSPSPRRGSAKKRRIVQAVTPRHNSTSRPTQILQRAEHRVNLKVWHQITADRGAWVSPITAKETEKDLVYPSHDAAHPDHSGLLYRAWDNRSQSPLTRDGFVSGLYKSMPLIAPPPPPSRKAPAWNAMATHFNREKTATPFVSCSKNLLWILRLGLMESKDRSPDMRISVIDPSRIEQNTIFYGKPFHDALCKKVCFTNGAFLYHGKYEFLVYHKIPRHSVIKTIRVSDLQAFANRLPAVATTLRLNEISIRNKSFSLKILPELKEQNVKLTPKVIRAIASTCKFLGLDYRSPTEFLSGVVTDICAGWGLTIEEQNDAEWASKSSTFAHAMCEGENDLKLKDTFVLMQAFLDGVVWGNAREDNPKFTAGKVRRTGARAKRIGLLFPAQVLVGQLEAAKEAVLTMEEERRIAFPGLAGNESSRNGNSVIDRELWGEYGFRQEARPSRARHWLKRSTEQPEGEDDDDSDNSVYEL